MNKRQKKVGLAALVGGLILFVIAWGIFTNLDFSQPGQPVTFGVSFSPKYASQTLGLNWTETYWAVINDLGVKNIRLAVPWDWVESGRDEFNFTDWDWMLEQAQKKKIKVILAIGRRTPRWPECHDPRWLAALNKSEQDTRLLLMLKKTVKHFKDYDNIVAWQVENEPLLNIFGECPKSDFNLLKQEISLVRSLDERPIIVTNSGELSSWDKAASVSDILGVTMYKTVWNRFIGVWRYPWPPAYYYYKAKRVKEKYKLNKIIVAELQAEPWATGVNIRQMPIADQLLNYSLDDFANNLDYVRQAGFDEAYLWGVEWWYWLKLNGQPEFWQRAQKIWQRE